jgi:hypothetical protein
MLSLSILSPFASAAEADQTQEKIENVKTHKPPTAQELEKHMQAPKKSKDNDLDESGDVSASWVGIIIRLAVVAYSSYKTYERVSEQYVEDAVDSEYGLGYFSSDSSVLERYVVGPSDDYIQFTLNKGDSPWGMRHILGKHHPKYYYGIDWGTKNTMHYDTTTMEDIGNMINIIAWQGTNSTYIHKQLKAGLRATVKGAWLGEDYVLVIGSNKQVITLYPDGWNSVTYEEN